MATKVSASMITDLTAQRDSALAAVAAEQQQITDATARRDLAQGRVDNLNKVLSAVEAE
jgi:hypothetical protein